MSIRATVITTRVPYCINCKFWTKNKNTYEYVNDGVCTGLLNGDAVEIELSTGWDGGVVSRILTLSNFYCRNHEEKI